MAETEARLTAAEAQLASVLSPVAWGLLVLPVLTGLLAFLGPAACGVALSPISDSATESGNIIVRGLGAGVVEGAQKVLLMALLCWPFGIPLRFAVRALTQAGRRIPAWTLLLMALCGCAPLAAQWATSGLPLWVGPLFAAPAFATCVALLLVNRGRGAMAP